MIAGKSLASLQIQAKKRHDLNDYALLLTSPPQSKAIKYRENIKGISGIPLIGQSDPESSLTLLLTKEGSFCLRFLLIRFPHAKMLKQLPIEIQNNDLNYHHLIRICAEHKVFIFYHESKTDLEVRSLISLKLRESVDLLALCEKLNLSFQEIKVSLDFVYMSHLSKAALMLGDKIVIGGRNSRNEESRELIFDCAAQNLKEHLVGMKYDCQKKALLAAGLSNYFIFEFNDTTVVRTKIIRCDGLGRRVRLLGWDPSEDLILIAQRTTENKENFYIADYRQMPPYIVNFCRDHPFLGTCYNAVGHEFLYVETDYARNKSVKRMEFKNFRERYGITYEQNDLEWDIEGSTFAFLPSFSFEFSNFMIRKINNMLFVKPMRALDDRHLRDHALKT